MPGVVRVLEQRTELAPDAIRFLDTFVDNWSLVADLSLSDLVLWVPTWNEGGALAVAQVRAATAPTSLDRDVVGDFLPRGRDSAVDQAIALGRITRSRTPESPLFPQDRETYPVRFGGVVLAVVVRYPSASPRVAGQLEQVYLDSADSIFSMIAHGENWVPLERGSLDSWDRPRVGDGLLRLNSDGKVEYASPNATSAFRRLGLQADLLDRDFAVLVRKLHESPSGPSRVLLRIAAGGYSGVADLSGSDATVMLNSVALTSEQPVKTIIMVKDVSAVREQQRALLSREATIQEINHRVKNNLQMVNSLLRIQSRRATHQETKDALSDAQQRISAISAIHDVLSKDIVALVNFDDLIDSIVTTATVESANVRVVRQGSGGMLPAGIATPLAMSMSELLHNALEHSGADLITLSITRRDRTIDCEVLDTGSGVQGEPGLGLTIVGDLVTQELNGQFHLEPGDTAGTRARITCTVPRFVPELPSVQR